MKKIIWISSYPKSGNTWVRYLLANYFFNTEMVFDKNIIRYISKFSLTENEKNFYTGNKLNLDKLAKFWVPAQEKLNVVDGQVTFLKTHNANISLGKNNFTNEKLTIAVIYIVRDPRDVVVSGANYFDSSYDEVIDNMCNKKFCTFRNKVDQSNIDVVSTWDVHFRSWINKMPNIPKILIKYEDLIKDTEYVFMNTIRSLSKILNFQIDEQKIQFCIENSKFEKLSTMEDKDGFKENLGSHQKFFRKGKIGEYESKMTKNQINFINDRFFDLMRYLKYL